MRQRSLGTPEMRLRILLAVDPGLGRGVLPPLLERHGFMLAGIASDGSEAVGLCGKLRPDAAVIDFSMPVMNGAATAAAIGRVSPKTDIVVLGDRSEAHYVLGALQAGAKGYVLKDSIRTDFAAAIRSVCSGGVYLSQRITGERFAADQPLPALLPVPLTARERQVLQLTAEGHTSLETARRLGISRATVDSFRNRIMVKLGIHRNSGLVRYAIRMGLIEP